jgi:acyl-coenzyme A synthetase/AMP-(fatty) acid ligase
MLLPAKKELNSVSNVTCGGEKADEKLFTQLSSLFPHAKILNVYASTEAGSLFASSGDIFEIKEEQKQYIKIKNNEILVHRNLLGKTQDILLTTYWYHTGDLVEIISQDPLRFRIIGRANEVINIGGYKVNLLEVEEILNEHPKVSLSKIYPKRNSLLGNILVADIQTNENVTEEEIRKYLSKKLQPFKVPRIINFVNKIELTRTGKLKRQ